MLLVPGSVLPAELAYPALIDVLGDEVDARFKELEVYAADQPPPGYGLEIEMDGIARFADEAGWERFHLVGYSGGGAACLAFAARNPERLESLALLEPAFIGRRDLGEAELALWAEMDRLAAGPDEEMMGSFMRAQLGPDVELPPPPPGPPPPWMAKRPAGIRAFLAAFKLDDIDHDALRQFDKPVLYALGARNAPGYFDVMGTRLSTVFEDFTLDVYPERHHFDPPHRVEPERLAASLRALWSRADAASQG